MIFLSDDFLLCRNLKSYILMLRNSEKNKNKVRKSVLCCYILCVFFASGNRKLAFLYSTWLIKLSCRAFFLNIYSDIKYKQYHNSNIYLLLVLVQIFDLIKISNLHCSFWWRHKLCFIVSCCVLQANEPSREVLENGYQFKVNKL